MNFRPRAESLVAEQATPRVLEEALKRTFVEGVVAARDVEGRVVFRNRMGKVMFIRVEDEDEDGVQLLRISLVDVGDATYTICKALDIGDHLAVRGAHERGPDGEHVIRVLHVRT